MPTSLRRALALLICLAALLPLGACGLSADTARADSRAAVTEIWVDPVNGNNANSGAGRGSALRTITAAWNRIPADTALSSGYTIQLVAGTYTTIPNYWENRRGTAAAPIVLRSADAPRSARIEGNINLYNTSYLTLEGLVVANDGDVFHCERCSHLTLSNVEMDGGDRAAHETVKINQSQYVTIELSDIHGSYENAIDFVAVQYATIRANRISAADDWCAYVKGGSAYITVEQNEFFDCGTGGFTAGQGTGFEWMSTPWLHYEVYAVRVVNNIIHDTVGAGFGVNGGYAVLIAHNTVYHVGTRSHLVEVIFGLRSCDGDAAQCLANRNAGGWGPSTVGPEPSIPNRDVSIYNNLIVNPPGVQSEWQHFTIAAAVTPPAGMNLPAPTRSDENLRIAGNVIWNGPADHPLGVDGDTGCLPANPTCNPAQLVQDNAINSVQPVFVNAAGGDFRLSNPADLPAPVAIPDFPAWRSFTPAVPAPDTLANTVLRDFNGNGRAGYNLVGAYAAAGAPPVTPEPSPTPVVLYLPNVFRSANPTATPTR